LKKRRDRVGGKLRPMKRCGRKVAERGGKGFRGDGAGFRRFAAAKVLR